MIVAYKGVSTQITKNFKSTEFDCHCKNKECKVTIIDEKFVEKIQQIRDMLGKPVSFSSAYRCILHNPTVSKALLSIHQSGAAVDVIGLSKEDTIKVKDLAKKLGLSIGHHSVFTHLDGRKDRVEFAY